MSTRASARTVKQLALASVGAPPRTSSRNIPVSLQSQRSDDHGSDLTALSASSLSPPPEADPIARRAQQKQMTPTDHHTLNYVWILLDFHGNVCQAKDEGDGVERIWWPGVVVPGKTVRVRLFGTIGSKLDAVVEVDTGKVLSISTSTDEIRFKHPTYVTNSIGASPKKRQKLDKTKLEAQWRDALSRLVHDMEENDMPSFVFLASVRHVEPLSLSPQWKQTKGKAKVASEDKPSSDWNPPPPDDSLRIPGELILARDTKHSSKYWPAQILNYIPPSTSRKRPLYEIQWMDSNKKSIEREQFYSYEESGFGTCTLGKFESVYEDVVNDTDDDDTPESLRGPSPEPCDPPPTGPAFCELSVHEQFLYTRPVMHAVLRDEYPPARAAHAQFIGGGKGRETLTKNAGERGLMDPREVERFHKLLEEWCLGRTRKGGRYSANDVHLEEEVVAGSAAEANNVVLENNGESAFKDNVIIAFDAAVASANEVVPVDSEILRFDQQRDGDDEISAAEAKNVVLEKNGETPFKDNAEAVIIAFDAAVDSANEVVPMDSEILRFDEQRDGDSEISAAEANSVVLEKNGESAFKDTAEAVIIAFDAAVDSAKEVVPMDSEKLRFDQQRDDDNEIPGQQIAPPSPTPTAPQSSPAQLPPSSFCGFLSEVTLEIGDEVVRDESTLTFPARHGDMDDDAAAGKTFDTTSTLSEASDVSDLMSSAMPSRQVGCAAYEGLSMVEKFDYCVNVLLPELLIQIHVWRMGERASIALLDEGEEQRLHDLGMAEKKKTDWVFDVKRLRAAKERELVNEERKRQTMVGSTSRPKRALRR